MTQAVSEFLDTIFGFRKFLIMLSIFVVAVIFRLDGQIDGSNFVDLLKTVTIAFFSANGIEHFSTMAKTYFESKGLSNESGEDKEDKEGKK